ncbi:MAG TPA: response regulator [Longimicrobiales bacterium]|nr:response regulator [Longimicrobiales bacterium]
MPDRTTPTILIVDDEEMVLMALRSFLELETAYRVVTSLSPVDALDTVRDERVDVIVADFMMPAMDGIEFLRQARDIRPHATRILLTGYADMRNAIRAINEAGLYHYLEKPWDNDRLKLVVRNGVERSSLVNELDSRITALESANVELLEIRSRLIKAFL